MLAFSEISLSFKNERANVDKVWDYLSKRGISKQTADSLGLHIMPAIELIAAARRSPNINAADNRLAVVFPHYRLGDGEPIEWWSSRLVTLGSVPKLATTFGDLVLTSTPGRGPGKMFCPPNEAPHGYLPPIYNWGGLARGQRVYIHESCIKAVNGCLLGKASVGLNGVWGWMSRKHGVALVEELRDLPWKALGLVPVIVYDSNAHHNASVQLAEQRLAAKLFEITGQQALRLRVPQAQGETGGVDQGFDDYRMHVGDDEATSFLEKEGEVVEVSEIEMLKLQLQTEVCVVLSMGMVAEQNSGVLMSASTFTKVNYGHYTAFTEDGERQVNVPALWLQDSRRTVVDRLDYAPGAPRLVRPATGGLPDLNTWHGMGISPEAGLVDIDPWLDLLINHVADDNLRQWIIAWCAYPLQNLGSKLNTYPLIFGPSGMGKNLFLMPLHRIYGDNAVLVGKDNLISTFNSVYAQKQLIHVDELSRARGDGQDTITQRVKMITTSDKTVVNTKGVKEYTVRNVANLAITSNYADCIKLDNDDRRCCVVRWDSDEARGVDHRGDQSYWMRYVKWLDGGGPAALYAWLLEQDIAWFDPSAWALDTPWKAQVTEATQTSTQVWCRDLYSDPDSTLPTIGSDVGKALFTSKELCVLAFSCSPDDVTQHQSQIMSGDLRNAGFKQANGGKPVKIPNRPLARYWIIRQRGKEWNHSEVAEHVKKY